MTTISILPIPNGDSGPLYQAIAGDRNGSGTTPGQALDAIATQLGESQSSTLIVLQNQRPDRFFLAEQCQRLDELMTRWRAARDAGSSLPPQEQAELDALVQAELRAAAKRTRIHFELDQSLTMIDGCLAQFESGQGLTVAKARQRSADRLCGKVQ